MKKDFEINEGYDKGFKVDELFPAHSSVMEIYNYFYPEIGLEQASHQVSQKALNPKIASRIAQKLSLHFTSDEE